MKVSDFLIKGLGAWGISRIFGYHVMIKSAQKLAESVAHGDDAALKHTGHILQQKIESVQQ